MERYIEKVRQEDEKAENHPKSGIVRN